LFATETFSGGGFVDTYHVVLYVHLLALFVGVGAGSVLLVCLIQLRAARTLADAVPWGVLAGKTEKAFPIAVIGLFGTGAYMTSHLWTWGTGWIDVSIVGLAVLALQGPLVGGRGGKLLEQALHANGPGELREAALRRARHPMLIGTELSNLLLVFAIVWNMTEKPGTGSAIASVVIGYALGWAVAMPLTRPAPAAETAAVAEAG
jgi:prolipoprotein diacylglyceryltransferase